MLLGKTDVLVFTQQVFLLRMDVRVIEENGVLDAGGLNGFHHLTGTGSTAGVQQQFAFALGQVEFLSNQFRHFSTSQTLSDESRGRTIRINTSGFKA
ncbi:hypothetical protein D3C80_702990 [compost metagenome]